MILKIADTRENGRNVHWCRLQGMLGDEFATKNLPQNWKPRISCLRILSFNHPVPKQKKIEISGLFYWVKQKKFLNPL